MPLCAPLFNLQPRKTTIVNCPELILTGACPAISELPSMSLNTTDRLIGTVALMTCNVNHSFWSGLTSQVFTCMDNGLWDPLLQFYVCFSKTSCQVLQLFSFATMNSNQMHVQCKNNVETSASVQYKNLVANI